MAIIRAIYENGVFRPLQPVAIPDGSRMEFEPRVVPSPTKKEEALKAIYAIMSERFDSGEHDTA